jgi:hypothetical protein
VRGVFMAVACASSKRRREISGDGGTIGDERFRDRRDAGRIRNPAHLECRDAAPFAASPQTGAEKQVQESKPNVPIKEPRRVSRGAAFRVINSRRETSQEILKLPLIMQPPMREDIRTFQEFYPNPMKLTRVIYSFAHLFLPRFVRENPREFFDSIFGPQASADRTIPQRIIQTHWMRFEEAVGVKPVASLEEKIFRRVSDLTISCCEIAGKPLALIKMPEPESPPEAVYVGVVLLAPSTDPQRWPTEAKARCFTIDRSHREIPPTDQFGFCEWGEAPHRLHAMIPPNLDEFLRAIENVLQAEKKP